MSKHLPWYKRAPADWRSGTRSCGMSMELRGFYSECLDAMWELQGQLPKDAKTLAMMLASNPRQVRALMPKLVHLGKMIETAVGFYNPRMMADILGVDTVKPVGIFAPARTPPQIVVDNEPASNGAPVESGSPSIGDRLEVETSSKIPKSSMFSTRALDTETELEADTEHNYPPSHLEPGRESRENSSQTSRWLQALRKDGVRLEVVERLIAPLLASLRVQHDAPLALLRDIRDQRNIGRLPRETLDLLAVHLRERRKVLCSTKDVIDALPDALRVAERIRLWPGSKGWVAWIDHFNASGRDRIAKFYESQGFMEQLTEFPLDAAEDAA